ncbi:MAG TPA: hypothetical protein VFE50_19050 [Cyclobacteriaceae bacterium]|nr:hypothetical protein [Cyclobacteriaceae bacterium]
MRRALIIFFLLFFFEARAQFTNRNNYDIKGVSQAEMPKRCGDMAAKLKSLPAEVQFATKIIGDSTFLIFNEPRLFWQFFDSKKDGFAIDIVNQDQFQCDNIQRLSGQFSHKGYLLEPVYRDDIKKRLRMSDRNIIYVFGGLIPKSFDKTKIETNQILIDDQYLCNYTTVVNVDSHAWEMLPMGLYYDTLNRDNLEERYKDLAKTLRFTIPFAKNTSVYKKEDIKPLYDSLKITDYAITDIRIRAFTSVEGSLQRNLELQDERAQSIVAAMQSFQPESIKSEITSNENWVEFLEAINGTPYQYLMSMSKDEIKEALKDQKLADKLEPTLAKERKAIIELVLEKRVTYSKATPAELKNYFSQSIAKKNIDEAMYLQEIIFHKIEREELPTNFINELEVPKAIEFGSLLINQAAYNFEHNNQNVFEALKVFNELNELLGGNAKVDYNISALRLKGWLKTRTLPAGSPLRATIESLEKRGIPRALVTRLMINYHIAQAEINYWEGKYPEREKSIRFILDSYKKINLKDADLTSLSRFLSYNSRFELAEKVLEPRIKALDASEDLLFHYVMLTISDHKHTLTPGYRSFLLNVVNSNKQRFCRLFEPVSKGGLSFQILEDAFLKKTWCENCNLTQ